MIQKPVVSAQEVSKVRHYIPMDDGLEPTDFDAYYDVPAKTDKDLAARWYIKVERDPERVAHLDKQQNAAIMELLQWVYDNRAQLRAKGQELPASWPE
jgi:hypothetical protein